MQRSNDRSVPRAFALAVGLSVWLATTVASQGGRQTRFEKINGHDAVAGEVIVKFRRTPSADALAGVARQINADRRERVGSKGAHLFHSKSFDADALIRFLSVQPDVEYAEPNFVVYADDTTPNDTRFPELWGLHNTTTPEADISAVKAWDVSTGTPSVVVAVVDTGIDYNHPDLAANIWSAPSPFAVTISGMTITCPAGSHGFNAITSTCDPLDDNDHGTHVAGTIGAVGDNNLGVVGVNWTTRIMGAKFLGATGSGSTVNAIRAIEFIVQTKQIFGGSADVRVLSNSWGGGGFSQALLDEINAANASGMLFVAAAGNSARNNDVLPFYPAGYAAPNVISVAATDQHDALASFSNYGATSVDLGAPGVFVLSTTRNNTYKSFSGTSMATPHVSGTAALVLSKCAMDTAALKSNLLGNVTSLGSLAGLTMTGGRLNADASIRACASPAPPPPAAPTALGATPGDGRVTLAWTGSSGADTYAIKRGQSHSGPYSTTVASGLSSSTSYRDDTVVNGTTYYYVVTASNGAGESGNSNEAVATPNAAPSPTKPAAPTNLRVSVSGRKKVTLTWSASANATSYNVKRSAASGGPFATIATGVTSTGYTNAGLRSHTTYYYVVSAVNSAGESPNSTQVSIVTP